MTAGKSAQVEQGLSELRFHWDEAYKITYHPGEAEPCHAERLGDGTLLTADSPWGPHNKIINDYRIRPAPRLKAASPVGDRPAPAALVGTARCGRQT